MTTRPQPVKNALANATIYAPTPVSEGEEPKAETVKRARINVRGETEFIERVRATWWNTMRHTEIRSFNDYVLRALERQVELDEATYNDGEPFTPRPAGTIPIGNR